MLLFTGLLVIQFFRIDKTNPESDPSMDFLAVMQPPAEIGHLVKASCYDCHSNHTRYPWYANIAPVSWWLKGHIDHGKENLNFSEWGSYSEKKANHKMEECYDKISDKEMPLTSYLIMHSDARLTESQRTSITNWIANNFEIEN